MAHSTSAAQSARLTSSGARRLRHAGLAIWEEKARAFLKEFGEPYQPVRSDADFDASVAREGQYRHGRRRRGEAQPA